MTHRRISIFMTLFYLFSRIVPRFLNPFFTSLGNPIVFFCLKGYREAVKENIRIIGKGTFSEKKVSDLAKNCFKQYSLKLLDYMAMERLTLEKRTKWIESEIGEDYLKRALEKGKGVICVTPHLGNWELGGYILAQKGYPIHILTLKEESPFLSRYEKRVRQRAGIRTIVIDPLERPNLTILEIVKILRRNEVVAIVSDRVYNGQGVKVNFFDRPTLFPEGPIHLALETGAEVIPVFVILNQRNKYVGIIDEPIPIRMDRDKNEAIKLGAQEMAKRFETMIQKYPDQWLNFFPFWKEER
jgi:KDO2-lipid IV(A) lauroyltransferase